MDCWLNEEALRPPNNPFIHQSIRPIEKKDAAGRPAASFTKAANADVLRFSFSYHAHNVPFVS
jgi:hypothetical protein